MPLPVLSLHDTSSGFITDISQVLPLSSDSVRMIQNARLPSQATHSMKPPRVFAMDLRAPAGGEESALFQIVKDHFEKFDWEGARVSLQHYLSLPRSKEVEARGRFYLGQTLYYTGNYREALMEFLSFRSFNPVEANAWIDAVLSAMVN
jgi:TolA-binding protein